MARLNPSPSNATHVNDLASYEFQIGIDRMHEFGFGITGLPNPVPSFPTSVVIMPDKKPCIVSCNEIPVLERTPSFIKAKAQALEYIRPAMEANAAIPLDSYCPVPEMKVYLPVPERTTIHRRQRLFAEHIVDEQVQKWLDEGIITTAPPGTPHNSPLTLAARRNSTGPRRHTAYALILGY